MIGLIDRALALNPSFARGWYLSGLLRIWAGQSDRAIEDMQTSLRLSPRGRMGQPLTVMGLAYFFEGKFDEAAAKLLLFIHDDPRLSHLVPRSRCMLCSYGAARRSAGNRRPASHDHLRNRSEQSSLSQRRAPRAVPVALALGGRRDGNKPEERVSYPGLEIIAKLATVLEVEPAELFKVPRGRT